MKEQRIYARVVKWVLIGLLVFASVYGGYSVMTYGNRWFASLSNPRIRRERRNVIAGDIIDRRGVTLATTSDGARVYQSNSAIRRAMVHVLGDDEGNISNGVETFQAGYLLGFERTLAEQIARMIRGEMNKGDSVTLTVDSGLCVEGVSAFAAFDNTRGKRGAAVVMNYRTGEVLCQISLPNFDPHAITDATRSDEAQPFWNRAVQSVYPPGSTFKIITATAALRSIPDILTKEYNCSGALEVMGTAITDMGGTRHGPLTLSRAFTLSCNNVFAEIALEAGDERLRRAAEDFGFNDNFLFRDLVVENSRYPLQNRNPFELAWSGVGQSQIGATPLHMCMIAAAIANGGVMMEPSLVLKAESDNSVLRYQFTTREYRRCLTADEANQIKQYMRAVVTSGTGTRARVDGLTICGKTGSAESSLNKNLVTHGWFIGFIDDARYPYAVSVLVESVNENEGGGSTAALIAQRLFAYVKNHLPVNAGTQEGS